MAITWPIVRLGSYLLGLGLSAFSLYETQFTGQDETDPMEWRRVVLRFARGGQDDIVVSLDILNKTSGGIDNTWITADYTACEALLDTFITAWKPFMSTNTTLVEYRWYRMEFRPLSDPKPFVPSILPLRLTTKSIAGTGSTAALPPQCACVISEITALPHHWGRMYMPFDGVVTLLTSVGQIPSGTLTTMADAAKALYKGLWDADYVPVVPITQINRDPARALTNVKTIRIDPVVDIQRRRRPVQVGASATRDFV